MDFTGQPGEKSIVIKKAWESDAGDFLAGIIFDDNKLTPRNVDFTEQQNEIRVVADPRSMSRGLNVILDRVY